MMRASAVLLIAGVGWIVLYVASFIALGSAIPTVDSSGQDVVDWFSSNATGARVYAWTAAFAPSL